MLLVDDVDGGEFLCNLFLSMYDETSCSAEKRLPKIATKALSYEFHPTAKGFMDLFAAQPLVNHSLTVNPPDEKK